MSELQRLRSRVKELETQLAQATGKKPTASVSEQELTAFFKHSPAALYIKDLDLCYIAVSPAYEDLFGICSEDAIGKTATDVLPWVHPEEHIAVDRRVIESGQQISHQHKIRRKDGSWGYALTTRFPVFDNEGSVYAIACFTVDITRQKEVEKQLSDKSRLLETTLELIPQGIAVIDRDMRIINCNQKFLERHCYQRPFPKDGLLLIDMLTEYAKAGGFGEGDPRKLAEHRLQALSGPGRPRHEERRSPSGRIYDVRRNPRPDGGYVVTHTDITALKRTEAHAEQTKQLLHETLESLPASVALYDSEDRLVFCNEVTRKIFHWQPELHRPGVRYIDQLRDSIAKGMVPEARGREDQWIQDRLRQRRTQTNVTETVRPGRKWLMSSFRRSSDGGTVMIRVDITEQKRIEQALRDSEESFRHLVESSIVGIAITRYGKVLFANKALADIFGYDSAADLSTLNSIRDLIAPKDRDRIAKYGRDRMAGKPVPEVYEFEGVRKDGSRIWVLRSARVVQWRGIRTIQSALIDMTKRRSAEEQLLKAARDAETANRSKSDFLAKMSHELRTPLNAVIGFSEVLDRETFGPLGHRKYQDYVKDIIASGRHLLDMINDILDMSKIEAGKYELHMSEVDLAQIVRESLQVISAEIDKKRLALRTELSTDLPLILGDKRAIKQVLLNLLSNAVKFSPEKSEIVVRAQQAADGAISLSVQDTGIGIAKDDIENVMKPFNQVGSAQTNALTGTGLGLPIVKSLIDMHGGRFVLQSKLGEGTTATVFFSPPESAGPSPAPPLLSRAAVRAIGSG